MEILNKSARWRTTGWWIGAAALPGVIRVLVIASSSGWHWGVLPPYAWARVNANALVFESIAIVAAAPLLGVAAMRRRREAGAARIALACVLTAAAFVLGAVVSSLALHPPADPTTLLPPYSTLLLAALALSSLGAAAAALLDNPLDAAASGVLLSLALGAGLFVAGPLLEWAPASLVDAALLASPVVAAASAADMDLFRGEPLYRFSPIAHSQFEYPSWAMACAVYAAIAVLGFTYVVLMSKRERRTLSAERITV